MTCKRGILIRNNQSLCELGIADTVATRMKGLLGDKPLGVKQGLLISPCHSIHTFRMKYALDVVFLNRAGKVIKISLSVKPNRIRASLRAVYVLEFKSGQAKALGIEKNQQLTWML
tara:strand:+ start:10489 stop:10836 length:348 start_codon:yes stop_codon:yes gene_type:complete